MHNKPQINEIISIKRKSLFKRNIKFLLYSVYIIFNKNIIKKKVITDLKFNILFISNTCSWTIERNRINKFYIFSN